MKRFRRFFYRGKHHIRFSWDDSGTAIGAWVIVLGTIVYSAAPIFV